MSQEPLEAKVLISIARHALEVAIPNSPARQVDLDSLPREYAEPRACFVTLRLAGELRGCIGNVEARRPLAIEVAEHARSAGFRDPRFPPLDGSEFSQIRIEVSVLSRLESFSVSSRSDLLRQLRPGVDGLVIEEGHARGVFLPSVWDQLPNANTFVSHLMQKAGLAEDHWSERISFSRFTSESYEEPD
jgi:AmmeMemoRadiSam system protein A